MLLIFKKKESKNDSNVSDVSESVVYALERV